MANINKNPNLIFSSKEQAKSIIAALEEWVGNDD
jgi:hypothetical protein